MQLGAQIAEQAPAVAPIQNLEGHQIVVGIGLHKFLVALHAFVHLSLLLQSNAAASQSVTATAKKIFLPTVVTKACAGALLWIKAAIG